MVVIDRIRYPSCYITFLWVTITCIARINNWNSFPFHSRILLLVTVSALHGPKSDDWWFWNLIVTLLWIVDNATWIDGLRTLTFGIVPLNLDFSKLGRPDNGEQVKSSLRKNLSCSVSHLKTKNKQENYRLFTFFLNNMISNRKITKDPHKLKAMSKQKWQEFIYSLCPLNFWLAIKKSLLFESMYLIY